MKKILSFFTIGLAFTSLHAQSNYEAIKLTASISQYQKAKEDLDKAMGNAKFSSKPEAFILKTSIYAALSMDPKNINTPVGEQLTGEANAAFSKFREMDPAMTLLSDPFYQMGIDNLYRSNYNAGYNEYAAKKWANAFTKLKIAVGYSDLMIERKIMQVPLDTNLLILAGVTAEQSDNRDEAAVYYTRLADKKMTGEGFESIYRFLVSRAFEKKDMASFEKYKAYGKELFPKSEYFNYDKVDFAVGLVKGFDEKVKAVEEVLATDPNNYKANQVLGELIYDTLNPREDGIPQHSNFAVLEKKMMDAFKKAVAAKPDAENSYLYMGDHFINKAVKVNDARSQHVKDMNARTKPGTKPSAEDVKKRDELDKGYGEALEGAREPYEKVCSLFAGRSDLDIRDKQQYKKAASYLADVFAFKKAQAKGKPADQAKYAAEEKKWNDLYDSIK